MLLLEKSYYFILSSVPLDHNIIPANTRRCFDDVDSTAFERYGRQMDVEKNVVCLLGYFVLQKTQKKCHFLHHQEDVMVF